MKLINWFNKPNKQEIGKTISWKDSIGIVFKISEFDASGTLIDLNGNVKSKNLSKPYGFLVVENPNLKGSFRLPIIHRDDFLLASSIFYEANQVKIIKTKDFLVTYRPKIINPNGLAGIHHSLHYVIAPLNTLNTFYNKFDSDKIGSNIESLFIKFVWEGEIGVQINQNPF